MSSSSFDPSLYTHSPVFSIAGGITLGRALVEGCPATAPPNVKKARDKVTLAVDAAQAAWAERQKATGVSVEDGRPIDSEADTSWGGLRMRLVGYATLPVERFPMAARADELVTILFGADGLEFLKAPYEEQWSFMDTLLKRIQDEGLESDICALAGPEFLVQLRDVQARYGMMVKGMLRRDASLSDSLTSYVRELQRAIVAYATKVSATVDEDEPDTVKAAVKALRPLAQFRANTARRTAARKADAATDDEESEATTDGAAKPAEAEGATKPAEAKPAAAEPKPEVNLADVQIVAKSTLADPVK